MDLSSSSLKLIFILNEWKEGLISTGEVLQKILTTEAKTEQTIEILARLSVYLLEQEQAAAEKADKGWLADWDAAADLDRHGPHGKRCICPDCTEPDHGWDCLCIDCNPQQDEY